MKKSFLLFLVLVLNLNYIKAQPELWGLAMGGGDDFGVVFSMTPGGTIFNNQFNLTGNSGEVPFGDMVEAPNGKYYGITSGGGFFPTAGGVIFEYDPALGTYTVLRNMFNQFGSQPYGSLVIGPSGNLYGTAVSSGSSSGGTLFEYNIPSNNLTVLHNFANVSGSGSCGTPVFASNGKIYGLTRGGGTSNMGVIFEYDLTTSTYTKKFDFSSTNGTMPRGSLMQASNGKLYGMTQYGGLNSYGTLFEFDITTNTFTKLRDLSSSLGGRPQGSLIEESGKLYGLNSAGGGSSWGTLFEYNIAANTYSVRASFNNTSNGGSPCGSLLKASNGKMYGLTNTGGVNNKGVIFEFNQATNVFTKKLDLSLLGTGSFPYGSFMQSTNGKLYAMTALGGSKNCGTIFEYDFVTNISTLITNLGPDARYPRGTLLYTNNKLYGMSQYGGADNEGVIFEHDPITNIYTKKIDLTQATGSTPNGCSLMQTTGNKIFGVTSGGGTGGSGTIFEYNPITNILTKKFDFNGTNGGSPMCKLLEAANGKLYGLTAGGGINAVGTLFEYDITSNTCVKKFDFSLANGQSPYGSLIEASPGKLLGLTMTGGLNNFGVLFEYDYTTSTFTKKFDFSAAMGSWPQGSLFKATNAKIYGMTYTGGIANCGVIFEYDATTSTYTKKYDFGVTFGSGPTGTFMQSVNGKLYGTTLGGGIGFTVDGVPISGGTIFEYDFTTNTCIKKTDFVRSNGSGCDHSQFVEICTLPQTPSTVTAANMMCVGDAGIKSLSISAISNATAYAWVLPAGTTILSGNTTNSITADFSSLSVGVYTLGVNGINICGNGPVGIATLSVSACTNIKDVEKGILISNYPNPFADYLLVNSVMIDSKGSISIYNNLGQIVYNSNGVTFENKINTSQFSSGIYLLEVKLDGKIISEKVIKQ